MFEQTFVREGQTKKPVTVMFAVVIQIAVIAALAIIPMIWFDVLPAAQLSSTLVAPPPPPPPPRAPDPAPVVKMVKLIPRQFDRGILTAPKMVPKRIALISDDDLPPANSALGVVGSIGGSGDVLGTVLGSVVGAAPSVAPPPPPQPKRIDVTPPRINVGGKVQAAKLIRQPKPVYPPLARQARISGVVRLSAVISRNGTIQELQVVSGHPLLVPAALEAVKQWVYQPTLLNAQPVEVETQIDVNFTLSQN